jgi:hypothetical protein
MGTSSSPAQLSAKLARLAGDFADLPHTLVGDAALATKQIIKAGSPARLRGVGKRGARLDVRYTRSGGGAESKALVFAVGPWQFIEHDTRPHRIPRQRGPRARKRYVVIPAVGPRRSANHPGTRGKHPWSKGVTAAEPVAGRMLQSRGELVMRRIF